MTPDDPDVEPDPHEKSPIRLVETEEVPIYDALIPVR